MCVHVWKDQGDRFRETCGRPVCWANEQAANVIGDGSLGIRTRRSLEFYIGD